MAWYSIGAEAGLWGLFAASFLAATLLPGGSEALLAALLWQHPAELWPALGLATLGNTLGAMTSWGVGRCLPADAPGKHLPQLERVRRFGTPILFFAWLPLVGDALCVAAGWLRLDWRTGMLCIAAGKFARYWLIAQASLS